LFLSEKRIK